MKKVKVTKVTMMIYLAITMMIYAKARATTYLLCKSADIKTCSQEFSKGEVVIELAKNPKSKIVKIDFVKLDADKGTLKVDKQ